MIFRSPGVGGAGALRVGGDADAERLEHLQQHAGATCRASQALRLRQLVRVLADAAALAQRGAVIDQDAHLFKSFRLSILL